MALLSWWRLVAALGLAGAASAGITARPLWAQVQSDTRSQADAQAAGTDSALEYRVKAAYLLNFTRYVEWPPAAFRTPSAPLVLCVYGANPFGTELEQIVRGRKSGGHPIRVHAVDAAAEVKGCHLVFLSRAEWRRRPQLLSELAQPGILTVGESSAFAEAGGVIALVIQEQAVRFDANLAAGEKAGLRLSSRMLSIASRLHGERKMPGDP